MSRSGGGGECERAVCDSEVAIDSAFWALCSSRYRRTKASASGVRAGGDSYDPEGLDSPLLPVFTRGGDSSKAVMGHEGCVGPSSKDVREVVEELAIVLPLTKEEKEL